MSAGDPDPGDAPPQRGGPREKGALVKDGQAQGTLLQALPQHRGRVSRRGGGGDGGGGVWGWGGDGGWGYPTGQDVANMAAVGGVVGIWGGGRRFTHTSGGDALPFDAISLSLAGSLAHTPGPT